MINLKEDRKKEKYIKQLMKEPKKKQLTKKELVDEIKHLRELGLDYGKQIEELQEQLKNAIVLPSYKKGHKIYTIRNHSIEEMYFQSFQKMIDCEVVSQPKTYIDEDGFEDVDYDYDIVPIELTFATLEEAQRALDKLKGEKK